jgi:superfamily II DNA or RNA helicase
MKTCKIIIKDEVNVKIEGLELSERKTFVKMFEYEDPTARFRPAYKLGRWNGKISYFNIGGTTYTNLLPEIIPVLDKLKYDIELEDLRDYKTTYDLGKVSANTFGNHVWPKGHPKHNEPIELRDYQIEIINNFLSTPQSVQEVATGAGKTITTAALSYSVQQYGRSIIVVPNKSLVTQTEEDFKNVKLDVGVYFGDRKEFGHTHTICTWQSLNNLLKDTKNGVADITIGEFIENVVCLIIDEVHMAKADVLKTLLTSVFSKTPIRWGLTGTIPKAKHESQSIFVSIGPLIGKLSASELQDRGVLAQCHVNIVQFKDNVEFTNYQSEIKHLLENSKRLDTIATLVTKIKETGNTLVLVDRVNAGKELINRLPNSVFISGETKLTERKEEYDEVATASDKIIVATYGVASVGINIPRIFNLVLIEPGKSFVRVIQSIGRGIRKAEDKDFVQIWDITSDCKFSKRHLTQRKTFYKEANYPFSMEKCSY